MRVGLGHVIFTAIEQRWRQTACKREVHTSRKYFDPFSDIAMQILNLNRIIHEKYLDSDNLIKL